MANINLYDLYNQKRRKYGVNDSTRFRESFVEAVNISFAEFNDMVFEAQTLSPIETFDDIIDTRLNALTSMTFDADSNAIISGREYWAVEYDFEFLNSTNGFTDTITDDGSNVVISIANNELTLAGSDVGFSATIPDTYTLRLLISSGTEGLRVLISGSELTPDSTLSLDDIPDLDWVPDLEVIPTYGTGDSATPQPIGTVSSRVISGVSGLNLKATKFYSSVSKILDFPVNEGTGSTSTDSVNSYTATLVGATWIDAYIEDSCALDNRYLSSINMALDYHLQDGGEWAIEPDESRERKWYGRGVPMARNTYQQTTTYYNPLGI